LRVRSTACERDTASNINNCESGPSGVSDERIRDANNANTRGERRPPSICLVAKILNYAQFVENLTDSIGDNFNLKISWKISSS